MNFGKCWEMFGHTLGAFSDRFGMVSGKNSDEVEKSSDEVEKMKFSNLSGSIFPASGCSKQSFLADPRTKIPGNWKFDFPIFFYRIFYIISRGVGGMGGALLLMSSWDPTVIS